MENLNIKNILFELNSEVPDIKKNAIAVAGKYGNKELLPTIKDLMNDEDVSVRYFAKRAYSTILERFPNEQLKKNINSSEITSEILLDELAKDPETRNKAILKTFNITDNKIFNVLNDHLKKETDKFCIASLVKAVSKYKNKESLSQILKFISHKDSRVRANTIEALDNFKDERIVEKLIILLDDVDNRVRGNAAKSLAKYKDNLHIVYNAIKIMINSSEIWMKDSAIYVLGEIKTRESVELLFEFALKEHENEYLYRKIINTLIKLSKKYPDISERIKYLQKDKIKRDHIDISGKSFNDIENIYFNSSIFQRKFIIAQLLKRNESFSDNFVEKLMENEKCEEIFFSVEKILSNRKGKLKRKTEEEITDYDKFLEMLNSSSFRTRINAVNNAYNFKKENSIQAIIKRLAIEEHNYVIATIVKKIGESGNNDIIEILIPFLKHSDNRVVANTIEGLGNINDFKILEYIESFLNSSNNRIRANAIAVVSKFKKEKALSALKKMITDPLKSFNKSAIYAVGELSANNIMSFWKMLISTKDQEIKFKVISLFEELAKTNKIAKNIIEKYKNNKTGELRTLDSYITEFHKTNSKNKKISLINNMAKFYDNDKFNKFLNEIVLNEDIQISELASSYLESFKLTQKKEELLIETGDIIYKNIESIKDKFPRIYSLSRNIFSIDNKINNGENVIENIINKNIYLRILAIETFDLFKQKLIKNFNIINSYEKIVSIDNKLISPKLKSSGSMKAVIDEKTGKINKVIEHNKKICLVCGYKNNPFDSINCLQCGSIIKRKVITTNNKKIESSYIDMKYLICIGIISLLIVISYFIYSLNTGVQLNKEISEDISDKTSLKYIIRRVKAKDVIGMNVKWEGIIEYFDEENKLLKIRRGEYSFFAYPKKISRIFKTGNRIVVKGKIKDKTKEGFVYVDANVIYSIK